MEVDQTRVLRKAAEITKPESFHRCESREGTSKRRLFTHVNIFTVCKCIETDLLRFLIVFSHDLICTKQKRSVFHSFESLGQTDKGSDSFSHRTNHTGHSSICSLNINQTS